eukprot:scaffold5269_cov255-Prasinococcus_capsulatus_cf.AAC.5
MVFVALSVETRDSPEDLSLDAVVSVTESYFGEVAAASVRVEVQQLDLVTAVEVDGACSVATLCLLHDGLFAEESLSAPRCVGSLNQFQEFEVTFAMPSSNGSVAVRLLCLIPSEAGTRKLQASASRTTTSISYVVDVQQGQTLSTLEEEVRRLVTHSGAVGELSSTSMTLELGLIVAAGAAITTDDQVLSDYQEVVAPVVQSAGFTVASAVDVTPQPGPPPANTPPAAEVAQSGGGSAVLIGAGAGGAVVVLLGLFVIYRRMTRTSRRARRIRCRPSEDEEAKLGKLTRRDSQDSSEERPLAAHTPIAYPVAVRS